MIIVFVFRDYFVNIYLSVNLPYKIEMLFKINY